MNLSVKDVAELLNVSEKTIYRMIKDETIPCFRVGGQWRQEMVISPTERYVTGGLYREIVPNRKLVFAWGAVGGWPALDPERPDDNPRVILSFHPHGAETVMDLLVQFPDHMTAEKVQWWMDCGMQAGWDMTIDRLVARYDGRGGIRRAG